MYQVAKKLRDSFVRNLREAFKDDPDYPCVFDPKTGLHADNTKIRFAVSTPLETFGVPYVVVECSSSRESRTLDYDLVGESDDGKQIRNVFVDSTIEIRVYSQDTVSRDKVVDAIFNKLKTMKSILYRDGVEIHSINYMPERKETVRDRIFYVSGLSLRVLSEWDYIEPEEATITSIHQGVIV